MSPATFESLVYLSNAIVKLIFLGEYQPPEVYPTFQPPDFQLQATAHRLISLHSNFSTAYTSQKVR